MFYSFKFKGIWQNVLRKGPILKEKKFFRERPYEIVNGFVMNIYGEHVLVKRPRKRCFTNRKKFLISGKLIIKK